MKKIFALTLSVVLAAGIFAGCTKKEAPADESKDNTENVETNDTEGDKQETAKNDLIEIKVGASPTPHAEILEAARGVLAEKGYDLKIIEFTDYVQPNLMLDAGDIDANYFQHKPYLDNFNEENKTNLVSAASIHYEPLGIYAGRTAKIEDLPDKAQIAVPNDTTNEARALILLENQALLMVNPDAGFKATRADITENPKNIDIIEIAAEQLARSLPDVNLAVINGNYAMQAGLDVENDALAKEQKDSESAKTYSNILAVRSGEENSDAIKALVEALESDTVKKFIEEKYKGAVVPMF